MNLANIYKKWLSVFTLVTMTSVNLIFADWSPEEFFFDKDFSATQKPEYIELKARVTKYLKGSWCSKEKINLLMDLIVVEKPEVCVEVGVFTGSSLLPVTATLKYLNHGKTYAIDAWSNSEAVKFWSDKDPNKAWWSSLDMPAVFNIFQGMLTEWNLRPHCDVIKKPSELAIDLVPEIDFLHLDGDYSEIGSMRDVQLYLPKVKSGGYILLSNLFTIVNSEQPKMKSFCFLFDSCEMVAEIERDNAILFRKI